MFMYTIFFLTLSTLSNWVISQDFYWRPYNGTAPADALLASTYYDEKFFVGRVPIPGVGLLIGRIEGGRKELAVCAGSPDEPVQVKTEHIEVKQNAILILCTGHNYQLNWNQANASTLHQSFYPLIPGGYEGPDVGTLYIGRHLWRNGPPPLPYYHKIGNIVGYNYNSSDVLYIDDGSSQRPLDEYEVLVWTGGI